MTFQPSENSSVLENSNNYVVRAYAAMRMWGDTDRDDAVLEGACEVEYLTQNEIKAAGDFLADVVAFRFGHPAPLSEFLPALLAEAAGGAENLAAEYGITIPRCASDRVSARRAALRELAKKS